MNQSPNSLSWWQVFLDHKKELQVRSEPIQIEAFQTSIWDETLYAVSKA